MPLALSLAACIGSAYASAPDLTALSLEQLTQIEVYGVSKSQERLLDAPASVSVITADQIRAFGYRTLAEIIASARGFFLQTDRAYTWLGVRGFAPVGDYNTRLLLLIDGNRVHDGVFESAFTGSEAVIDVELIDRVEVIRGPSSSVYGTSAFFGVVNVVTKDAAAAGGSIEGRTGSGRERGAAAGVAGRFAGGGYLLRASRTSADGLDVELVPAGGRFGGVDGLTLTRAFAKLQWEGWRVSFGAQQRRKDVGYGLYGTDPGDDRAYVYDAHVFADARYEAQAAANSAWSARVFYGSTPLRDVYVYAGDVTRDWYPARWAGTEWQLTHRFSDAHRLIGGVELRRDLESESRGESDALGRFVDVTRPGSRHGVFVQDDFRWSESIATSLGVRHDRLKDLSETSPRLALIWRTSPAGSLKLLAGTAFRAPSTYEGNYAYPGFYLTNPALQSERIRTLDLDYETALGAAGRFGLTLYRYRATRADQPGRRVARGRVAVPEHRRGDRARRGPRTRARPVVGAAAARRAVVRARRRRRRPPAAQFAAPGRPRERAVAVHVERLARCARSRTRRQPPARRGCHPRLYGDEPDADESGRALGVRSCRRHPQPVRPRLRRSDRSPRSAGRAVRGPATGTHVDRETHLFVLRRACGSDRLAPAAAGDRACAPRWPRRCSSRCLPRVERSRRH